MENTKISVQDLNLHYGTNHALKHVNMEIRENASGAEYERDAQHLEIVGGERVESDAVGQRRAAGFGDLDLRGSYAGLCHFLAL